MTSPTRKSAEEIAQKIYQALLIPETSLRYSDPTILIAQALTEFAEQRQNETENYYLAKIEEVRKTAVMEFINQNDRTAFAEGYARCREEAALCLPTRKKHRPLNLLVNVLTAVLWIPAWLAIGFILVIGIMLEKWRIKDYGTL